MNDKLKIDDTVIKTLDLKLIRRLLCKTDKGELELVIRKGETKYFLTLDSVPLDKQINRELMELLFPIKEVNIPQVKKDNILQLVKIIKNNDKLPIKLGRSKKNGNSA